MNDYFKRIFDKNYVQTPEEWQRENDQRFNDWQTEKTLLLLETVDRLASLMEEPYVMNEQGESDELSLKTATRYALHTALISLGDVMKVRPLSICLDKKIEINVNDLKARVTATTFQPEYTGPDADKYGAFRKTINERTTDKESLKEDPERNATLKQYSVGTNFHELIKGRIFSKPNGQKFMFVFVDGQYDQVSIDGPFRVLIEKEGVKPNYIVELLNNQHKPDGFSDSIPKYWEPKRPS